MNSEIIDTGVTVTPVKTRGAKFEGIAFSFCKAATILLIITVCGLQRFALPIVAGATALFYLLAYVSGQSDTRCILKKAPLVATFWIAVALAALYYIVV